MFVFCEKWIKNFVKKEQLSSISYGKPSIIFLQKKKGYCNKKWPIKNLHLNNGLSLICDDTPSRDKLIRDE